MSLMTDDYALELIRKSAHFRDLEKRNVVKKTTVHPLPSEDQGYLSIVYEVLVEFEDGSEFSFILKTPSAAGFPEIRCICHNRECLLYELLSQLDVPIPKLFALQNVDDYETDTGFIAMESFIGKAVILRATKQATSQQIANLASHLGNFRAEVEKLPKDQWSSLCDTFRLDDKFISFMLAQNLPILLGHDNDTFSPLVEKLTPYLCQPFYKYLLQNRATELGVESLVHSDLHGGNTMLKTNPDGSTSDELATLIDWQSAFSGNALFDLARFTCLSTDADVRRSIEDEAVDLYYENYIKNTKAPNPSLTREVCHELYDLGVLLEAIEWQYVFGVIINKLTGQTQRLREAFNARVALRAKFCMEDGIRIVDKYQLDKVLENLLK